MVLALLGGAEARLHFTCFAAIEDDRDWAMRKRQEPRDLVEVTDPNALRAEIEARIEACRALLRLPA